MVVGNAPLFQSGNCSGCPFPVLLLILILILIFFSDHGAFEKIKIRSRRKRSALDRVGLQLFEGDELDRGRVRRLKVHGRRDPAPQRLLITRGAKTPFVAGLETGKTPLGMRRHQIVALKNRIVEKFARHLHANRVLTNVIRTSPAISVPIKSSKGIATTTAELSPKNVRQHDGIVAPWRAIVSVLPQRTLQPPAIAISTARKRLSRPARK
jgi:hypothetical protein